jgi:hypothetical protein
MMQDGLQTAGPLEGGEGVPPPPVTRFHTPTLT